MQPPLCHDDQGLSHFDAIWTVLCRSSMVQQPLTFTQMWTGVHEYVQAELFCLSPFANLSLRTQNVFFKLEFSSSQMPQFFWEDVIKWSMNLCLFFCTIFDNWNALVVNVTFGWPDCLKSWSKEIAGLYCPKILATKWGFCECFVLCGNVYHVYSFSCGIAMYSGCIIYFTEKQTIF